MERDDASTWDGVTLRTSYKDWVVDRRDRLADAARDHDWSTVFELLEKDRGQVNRGRLGGRSAYTPLHQAAWHGVRAEEVHRLIALGAWRTLRTARGERAVDIVLRKGHHHLLAPLTPVIHHPLPAEVLKSIQHRFHLLIHERAHDLVTEQRLRLPELEPLTEQRNPSCWFAVPGMYGGFKYRLEQEKLIVESWCRVVGGSGQRHVVDEHEARLVAEGFV
ncbi:ankyrin repeat domain-containing protein [Streptosporangium sp. NPDC051022]|uniref:ankyrin repeat domain-containing protein n=1 Tax=Streptosporangium sp. NPDC051022 TaxID=3155752 RepID=UPI00341DBE75